MYLNGTDCTYDAWNPSKTLLSDQESSESNNDVSCNLSMNCEIYGLLETTTRGDTEQQDPLPELVPWQTVNGHVRKVSP